jgi:uncharacterized membrane protein
MERDLTEQLVMVDNPAGLFADLILVVLWLGLTVISIFVPPLNNSFLRVLFALPSILFIPGYALIAALFPKRDDLDAIERVALSFGLSIAVVPLVGLALNYTPWGIRLEPVVTSLVALTLFLVVMGALRRAGVVPEERFTVPFRTIGRKAKSALAPSEGSKIDRVLNVILLASILVAIGATIYVIAVPKEGEHFTEFYILGKEGKAADYPRDLVVGGTYPILIGIGNHEYRNISYTVECYLMNMTFDNVTNTSSIQAMRTLDRFIVTVPHNVTVEVPWNLVVPASGYNRVEFLLFNETVPRESLPNADRLNMSYRDLHLWVEIR